MTDLDLQLQQWEAWKAVHAEQVRKVREQRTGPYCSVESGPEPLDYWATKPMIALRDETLRERDWRLAMGEHVHQQKLAAEQAERDLMRTRIEILKLEIDGDT